MHISRVNCTEITGDKLRQPAYEFLALNVDFNKPGFDRPHRFQESSVRKRQICSVMGTKFYF